MRIQYISLKYWTIVKSSSGVDLPAVQDDSRMSAAAAQIPSHPRMRPRLDHWEIHWNPFKWGQTIWTMVRRWDMSCIVSVYSNPVNEARGRSKVCCSNIWSKDTECICSWQIPPLEKIARGQLLLRRPILGLGHFLLGAELRISSLKIMPRSENVQQTRMVALRHILHELAIMPDNHILSNFYIFFLSLS